jgi:probable addiction module antidote protein
VRPVGEGVSEMRVQYGPDYTIYFVKQGEAVAILLAGSDKISQQKGIKYSKDLAPNLQETPMTKTITAIWDPAARLNTTDDATAYLEAAFEDGDPQVIAAVIEDLARAKGMSQIAREAGLGRESLYKALCYSGNPELATVLKVIAAMGLELHIRATDHALLQLGAGQGQVV